MPGIVGLVTRMPRRHAEAELQTMLGVMQHETFYVTRRWIDEDLGLYLGWTAREGSFSDANALENESGDRVLVFCGEDYPEAGTATGLKQRGHHIGSGRSAYLVHLSEEDPGFLTRLNGLFQGILADRRQRTVTLFNDRYSMHRVYWHEAADAFYFAAEAKALLAVRPELRRIDPRSLGESLALGCVVQNRTLYEGIEILPAGSAWVFENGGPVRKASYFDPAEWENQPLLDDEAFYRELREIFARVVPRLFEGPEPIGMSLTGGLDTRMIMAWQRCQPGSLPCYTYGGSYRECQDVMIARRIAAACRQPFEAINVGAEFLSRFAHYADRAILLSDGCVDVSLAPDVYLNERARLIAPVRMTGLYGGEVLRRVRSFKPIVPLPRLFPDLEPRFEEARRTYASLFDGHPLSFAVFRQAPWHHYNTLCMEQTQFGMRSPFLDNEFVKTLFRAPESSCRSNDVSMRLIAEGDRALTRIPTDRGLGWNNTSWDKLSNQYQEFTFKAEYAYDYGMPQWLARLDHSLQPLHVERLFLGRHKGQHFRIWYRDPLSEYVRATLLDSRSLSRAYLDRRTLEDVVMSHTRGVRNYTMEIHRLLKMELVHRQFVDQPVAAAAEPLQMVGAGR
jgi:asparagine synthase (glutamine-hydrolysing)